MEDKVTVRSFRAPEEVFERFREIAQDFPNQGAALSALVDTWRLQAAKTALPQQQADIEHFDAHLQSLQAAFLHSLELVQSAEERAAGTFRAALDSKDGTILDLQARIGQMEEAVKVHQQQADESEKALEACKKELSAEREARSAAESAARAAQAALADKGTIIDSLNRRLVEAEEAAGRAQAALTAAQEARAEVSSLKQQLAEAKQAAALAAERAALDTERAVLQVQRETQEETARLLAEWKQQPTKRNTSKKVPKTDGNESIT